MIFQMGRTPWAKAFAVVAMLSLGFTTVRAADIYWDGATGTWSTTNSWSTSTSNATPNPGSAPGASDNAIFNISSVNSAETVSLGANQSALSLLFKNTNTTTINGNSSGTTARTLTVGSGGITLQSGAGAVTFNNTNGTITVYLNANQSWTNSSSSLLSMASNISNVGNSSPYTLTLAGAGSGGITLSGTISDGGTTGTTGITINRSSGGVTLSGSNTYSGNTTLTAGTLTLGNTNALRNSTLSMNGGTLSFGSLTNSTIGGLSGSGNITLTNTTPAAVAANIGGNNQNTTYSGALSGSGSVTKSGTGTLTLTGTNTYTGTTTISTGTLQIGAGGTTGALTNSAITNNSALVFNRSDALTYSGAISGTGSVTQSGSGNLTLSGGSSYSGNTTLSTGTLTLGNATALQNSTLAMNGGTLSFGTLTSATLGGLSGSGNIALTNTTPAAVAANIGGNNQTTSYTGTLSGTGSLTKSGTGSLTLTAANTFTGNVTVSNGTLVANNSAISGTYDPPGPAPVVNLSTGGFGALGNHLGLVSDTTVVTVSSGATLAVQSSLTGGIFENNTQQYMTMSLNGTGYNGAGALTSLGGNSTWLGNITLAGNTTINNAAATGDNDLMFLGPYVDYSPTTLKLNNNTLTFGGTGDVYVASTVGNSSGDTGSVIVDTAGRIYFAGSRNYYTGTTTVNNGTLTMAVHNVSSTTNVGILGNLTIGNDSGAANSASLQEMLSDQISDSVSVTIKSDGVLDLGTFSRADTVGTLNLYGGRTSSGTGMLYLNGAVNVGNKVSDNSTITSTMDGRITFNNTNTVTVSGTNTLLVNAWIASGAFVKAGTGTMVLTYDNYNSGNGYLGTTEVSNGILSIQNSGALGLYYGGDASAGTSVGSAGTLRLDGTSSNIAVVGERLTIDGAGYSSNGALNSLTGTNSWAGPIIVATGSTGATIKTDAGTLTLSGVITGSATSGNTQTLTFDGSGNTTVTGVITDNRDFNSPYSDLHIGTVALTKNGSGTLTLSNAGGDTFRGAINVNAGKLLVNNNNVLAYQANTVNVASGAEFSLTGGNSYTNTISKLTGAGVVSIAASTSLVVNTSVADTFDGRLADVSGSGGLFEKQGHGTFTFSSTGNTSAFNFSGTVQLTATASTDTLEFQGGSGTINTSTNALYIGTLKLTGGTLLLTNAYINVGTLNITGDTILDFGTTGRSILNATNIYIAAGVTVTVKNWTSEVDFLFANSSFKVDNSSGQTAVRNQIGTTATYTPENQVWFQGDPWSPDGSHTTWIDNSNTYGQYTNWEIRPVPEPSTYGALLLSGCFGLLIWKRVRSRRQA